MNTNASVVKDFKIALLSGNLSKRCYKAMEVKGVIQIDGFDFQYNKTNNYTVFLKAGGHRVVEIGPHNVDTCLSIGFPENCTLPFPFEILAGDEVYVEPANQTPEQKNKEMLAALNKVREDINYMLNERKLLNGNAFDYLDDIIEKCTL